MVRRTVPLRSPPSAKEYNTRLRSGETAGLRGPANPGAGADLLADVGMAGWGSCKLTVLDLSHNKLRDDGLTNRLEDALSTEINKLEQHPRKDGTTHEALHAELDRTHFALLYESAILRLAAAQLP